MEVSDAFWNAWSVKRDDEKAYQRIKETSYWVLEVYEYGL